MRHIEISLMENGELSIDGQVVVMLPLIILLRKLKSV